MASRTQSSKEKILDAAERLIAQYGFRKMSMEDLATEAQVAKRTIYTYFESKEAVGLASLERVALQAQQKMRTLSAAPGSATTRIREMLRARVMAQIQSPQPQRQSLDHLFAQIRPAYLTSRQQRLEVEAALLAAVIEQGQKEGAFTQVESLSTAETLLQATAAFLPFGLSVQELGKPREIERKLEQMIDLLLNGLVLRRGMG